MSNKKDKIYNDNYITENSHINEIGIIGNDNRPKIDQENINSENKPWEGIIKKRK